MPEDQNLIPSDKVKATRNPDGTFIKGIAPNPSGQNGTKGFARWEIRVEQLSNKYDSVEKLMALFTLDDKGNMQPSKELMQMNPIDAGIIRQLIGQLTGRDTIRERESFWDRYQGKPKQTVEHQGLGKGDIPTKFDSIEQAAAAFEDIVRK